MIHETCSQKGEPGSVEKMACYLYASSKYRIIDCHRGVSWKIPLSIPSMEGSPDV